MQPVARDIAGLTSPATKPNDGGSAHPALVELVRALARLDAREDHDREIAAHEARRDLR